MSDYRLTTSFPYLARRVGMRIGELFETRIAPYGITVSMYRVLASLMEKDGQTLGGLSMMTTIELSTLSRLVGTMRRKGLLTRRRPPGNARVVEISLSAKGRALALELMPLAAHFESVAVEGLTKAEVARLKSWLTQAFANLDKLDAASPPASKPPARRKPLRTGKEPALLRT